MVWQTVPVFDDSQKEGVQSKCLVDFRADHLPFERVMSDFRKNILQTDFEGKNSARKYLGRKLSCTEINISLMAYNAEKKSYSAICWGKKIKLRRFGEKVLTLTKSPIPRLKSQIGRPLSG